MNIQNGRVQVLGFQLKVKPRWECLRQSLWSHDAVGDVLEGVVEFGGDGAHGSVHHLLHQQLQLLLGQRHVEPLLQAADCARAVEAGKVGTWRNRDENRWTRSTWPGFGKN